MFFALFTKKKILQINNVTFNINKLKIKQQKYHTFVINKCYFNKYGNKNYNVNSIIGIFDNYYTVYDELIKKLNKLKYDFVDKDQYIKHYYFVEIYAKNGKELLNGLCFVIIEKKIYYQPN